MFSIHDCTCVVLLITLAHPPRQGRIRTDEKNLFLKLSSGQELSRFHNKNVYLGQTLLDDMPPLSIGTLSEKCINRGALSFLVKHGRTKQNYCHYCKLNSPVLIILKH